MRLNSLRFIRLYRSPPTNYFQLETLGEMEIRRCRRRSRDRLMLTDDADADTSVQYLWQDLHCYGLSAAEMPLPAPPVPRR